MKKCDVVRRCSAAITIMLAAFFNLSGQGAYIPPDKPRLVIGIIVEQLKYDRSFADQFIPDNSDILAVSFF